MDEKPAQRALCSRGNKDIGIIDSNGDDVVYQQKPEYGFQI
jgi:hypothetical protein